MIWKKNKYKRNVPAFQNRCDHFMTFLVYQIQNLPDIRTSQIANIGHGPFKVLFWYIQTN